ncbi:MAG: response regulator [Synergistaceae bacterium]|nr:response regulator [Prevotella sp.]MBQ3446580.1 response regulator [Synergistaceae bacterium]MBQ3654002.1 response regulator [Synergistaceae bacterium]
MLVINNLSQAWLEITVIPCLAVMFIFLGGRLATTSEINRRFLLLVVSTLLAACVEVIIKVFLRMNAGVVQRAAFFALININAYCLMTYVAAYTRSTNKRLIDINFLLLAVSLVMLFVFKENERIYVIFSPGFAVFFVAEGFVLQLIYQKYYTNGQFIVMNALFILLIDSFLIQYLFDVEIALVYTVATMMLVFTFFYLEAPTYRQLIIAHSEIEEARLRAEASIQRATIANKAKSNFLASTSHEIRTPMNAILGINDMILAENPDTETRNASLSIKAAGEYLLALVNNILDISKIEAGKMDLYEADYHLWELLKDCEHDMTLRLAGKAGLKFVLDVDKDLPELLHGDVLRLKQVLLNLLSNSAKYTLHGSISLTVRGAKLSGTAILMKFVVQDTGIGMRDEEAAVIYEPFERANILETRHIPGAGLGLTLVKNIVDIMSGRISLQTQYGNGTAFTVEIPQRVGAGEHMTVGEYEQFLSNQTVHEDTGPSTWHDARILVVDDTPVNLVVAKGMLKASEAEVDTCEGGEDALELMKANHYDVVFLDHKMPGIDGVETLKKAKEFVKGTKFIALTANSGGNARQEYIALGFDDYLPKPFKSEEMLRVLKSCLNG